MPTRFANPLPVVFVHSLAGSPEQWTPQIAHLEPEREVIAVALPGHADMAAPERYSVDALSEAIARATALLSQFVLVGHSAGAVVAIAYASEHPDRVAGLVLVDPGTDMRAFPEEQAAPLLAALRSDAYVETAQAYWSQILENARPETRERAMADLRATSPEAMPDVLSTLGRFDAVTPLREYAVTHPVFAVTTPLSDGPHALHAVSPEIEHARVEGTSHWVHLDKSEEFNAILDRFLDAFQE